MLLPCRKKQRLYFCRLNMLHFARHNIQFLAGRNIQFLAWRKKCLFIFTTFHNAAFFMAHIYIKSPFVVSVRSYVTFFLRGNNSALGGHRALPKVANERYCYIFLIFGVGIAGTGTSNQHWRRQKFVFE